MKNEILLKKKDKVKANFTLIHMQATKNNTILTLTDPKGIIKAWVSCGSVGFKGSRRKTNYAALQAGENIAKKNQGFRI